MTEMVRRIRFFFFPADEGWKESLPAFVSIAGLLVFFGFMGFSKSMLNIGAVLVCVGLVMQTLTLGPKSFSILQCRTLSVLFLLAFGWLAFRSCAGIDVPAGTDALRTALYKGMAVFIAGTQVFKRPRYIKILIVAVALASFIQGLNGIWQYRTGLDFIKNSPPLGGRLTSAFSTYRVGDLTAMFLLPMFCLPWALPKRLPAPGKAAAILLLLLPPVFLLIFADSRSGFNFLFVSLVALLCLRYGIRLTIVLPALAVAALVVLLGVSRYAPDVLMRDGRVQEVWPFAWAVFKAHPVIGVGVAGYTAGYAELGLTAQMHSQGINHPHNIYLQLLAEMGIVGFGLWVGFFAAIIRSGWKTLRAYAAKGLNNPNLRFAALCWAGCCGYMIMAGSAHSFLRDWWFGLCMFYFGVTAGATASHASDDTCR